MRDTTIAYGPVSRGLHWLLLVLIAVQFLLALGLDTLPAKSSVRGTAFFLHESFGLLILAFGLILIIWRGFNPRPSLADLAIGQRLMARLVHVVIYLAIVAQPVIGIMLVMTHGHDVPFFGVFRVPQMLGESRAAGSLLGQLHTIVGLWVLLPILCLHAAAALYHQFVRRDRILARMWRGGG